MDGCRCRRVLVGVCVVFFFNDTATTEIYTLSLHDALPICIKIGALPQQEMGSKKSGALPNREMSSIKSGALPQREMGSIKCRGAAAIRNGQRSEEHTSELQSLTNLVCRLLLEKKKKTDRKSTL